MKTQLYIYLALIVMYIAYNQFFQVADEKINTVINLVAASVLFLYMGYIAWLALKKLNTRKK